HNQESEEENKLFSGAQSLFDSFYEKLNLPAPNFKNAASSLKAHLKFFPEDVNVLFVHNTASSKDDINYAMNHHPDLYWCFCPNANLYIENKLPAFNNFLPYSFHNCLGTDSLASNNTLSILEEIKTIQRNDTSVSTDELIQWATKNGARFFGWEKELGSIKKGKVPGINLITHAGVNLQL